MTDYTVSTVPWTIQLRPSRLVAMLLAAVVITAALTWSLADISLDSGSQTRDAAPAVATQHDLHAAYAGTYAGRTVPVSADHALAAATLAAGVTPAAMGMTLTPEIVAGAYGGGQSATAMTLTPEIVAGAYGGGTGPVAMTLTPEIVAGAYGGETGPVAMTLTPEIVAGAYGGGHD